MEKGKKVFVGLSGGVDSAVSAYLLQKDGYDVTGVFIKIQIPGYPCPAAQDRIDAMRVAAHLKIPFIEIDLSKEYETEVFRNSLDEYKKGRTPNPDTLCNQKIKFGAFYSFAMSKGADFIATGHYARTSDGRLFAGVDADKDQSYFLWMVPKEALRHTVFPIGSMKKSEVRALAQQIALPNFDRPDSQGLCFLGDISIEDMIERELPQQKGKVLSESGEVVGEHGGAAHYTLGQRHGFTLFAHTPETKPHFVIAKDTELNTITVSENRFPQHAEKTEVALRETNFFGEVPKEIAARYRYRQKFIPATFEHAVLLQEPHYVPSGQSLVLYSGEECLGGGIISSATLK